MCGGNFREKPKCSGKYFFKVDQKNKKFLQFIIDELHLDQDDKGTISKGVKKSMFENTLQLLKNKSMFSWCVISSSTLLDDLSQTLVPEKLDQIISNSGDLRSFGDFLCPKS